MISPFILNTAFMVFDTMNNVREKTQEKIDESIKLYFSAKSYPRKKKKAMKKKALADYNFWIAIQKWEKGFGL